MPAASQISSASTNHGTPGLSAATFGDCVRVIRADRDFNRMVVQQLEEDGWDDVQIFHEVRDMDAAGQADAYARALAQGLASFSKGRVAELRAAMDSAEVRAAGTALRSAVEDAVGEIG